jgi:integrase
VNLDVQAALLVATCGGPTELARLLANAGKWCPLIGVGAFAGLRLGEALGLRWQDVDLVDGFLRVRIAARARPAARRTQDWSVAA